MTNDIRSTGMSNCERCNWPLDDHGARCHPQALWGDQEWRVVTPNTWEVVEGGT